jgi:hypothetical protein
LRRLHAVPAALPRKRHAEAARRAKQKAAVTAPSGPEGDPGRVGAQR